MSGKIPDEVAIVSLALVRSVKQIQEDLGDIRFSDVVDILFKFGNTVISVYRSLSEDSEVSVENLEIMGLKGDGKSEKRSSISEKMDARILPMFG